MLKKKKKSDEFIIGLLSRIVKKFAKVDEQYKKEYDVSSIKKVKFDKFMLTSVSSWFCGETEERDVEKQNTMDLIYSTMTDAEKKVWKSIDRKKCSDMNIDRAIEVINKVGHELSWLEYTIEEFIIKKLQKSGRVTAVYGNTRYREMLTDIMTLARRKKMREEIETIKNELKNSKWIQIIHGSHILNILQHIARSDDDEVYKWTPQKKQLMKNTHDCCSYVKYEKEMTFEEYDDVFLEEIAAKKCGDGDTHKTHMFPIWLIEKSMTYDESKRYRKFKCYRKNLTKQ